MQQVLLGSQGLCVSRMGLGCMGMSEGYGKPDLSQAKATLKAALNAGVNFFDSADYYGRGENERLLGKAFKTHRREVILASKCGIRRDAQLDDVSHIDNSPEYIIKACEQSLRRLQTDVIDLFYLHRIDYTRPIEDAMEALSACVQAGKIRYVGLSEADAETIARAHAIHPLCAVQSEYSLWTRTVEDNEVLRCCRELGIGLVASSPLGRGFLTGKVHSVAELPDGDCRRELPRFQEDVFAENIKLLPAIQQVANQLGCTLAQCALAWLLAQGEDIIPIPGTKQQRFLQENIETVESVRLSEAQCAQLTQAAKRYAPVGARYNARAMAAGQLDD